MPFPLVEAWGDEPCKLNCTLTFIIYSLLYWFYMYCFSVGWNVWLAWCYGNKGTWVQTLCDGLCVCLRSIFTSSARAGAPWSPRMGQSWACASSKDLFRGIFEGTWILEVRKMHMKTCCWYSSLALFSFACPRPDLQPAEVNKRVSTTCGGFCMLRRQCDAEKCLCALGVCFLERSWTAHFSRAAVQGHGHWHWGRKDG